MRHLTEIEMREYGSETLSRADFLRVQSHLEECNECRRRLDQMFPAIALLDESVSIDATASDDAEFHLNYDDHLKPYVFGSIGTLEREIVESHAEFCDGCRGDLNDLLGFHRELEQQKEIRKLSSGGLFGRIGEWLSAAGRQTVWIAAAACVLVAVGLGTFFAFRDDRSVMTTATDVKAGHVELPVEIPAEAIGDSIPPQVSDSPQIDLAAVKLPSFLKELRPVLPDVRGAAESRSIIVLSPNGTVIIDRSPALRWERVAGKTTFNVAVFDSDLNRVAGADDVTGSSWNPPALLPGRIYNWQVSAPDDGSGTIRGQGRFFIVSNESKTKIAGAKKGPELAKAYAEAGLLTEAAEEVRTLLKRVSNYPGARRLLARIEAASR